MNPYQTPTAIQQNREAIPASNGFQSLRWWKVALLLFPTGFLILMVAVITWITTWEKLPGSLLLSGDEIRTAYQINAVLMFSAIMYTITVVSYLKNHNKQVRRSFNRSDPSGLEEIGFRSGGPADL